MSLLPRACPGGLPRRNPLPSNQIPNQPQSHRLQRISKAHLQRQESDTCCRKAGLTRTPLTRERTLPSGMWQGSHATSRADFPSPPPNSVLNPLGGRKTAFPTPLGLAPRIFLFQLLSVSKTSSNLLSPFGFLPHCLSRAPRRGGGSCFISVPFSVFLFLPQPSLCLPTSFWGHKREDNKKK